MYILYISAEPDQKPAPEYENAFELTLTVGFLLGAIGKSLSSSVKKKYCQCTSWSKTNILCDVCLCWFSKFSV